MFKYMKGVWLALGALLILASCDSFGLPDPEPVDPATVPKPRKVAEEDYTVFPNGLKLYDFKEGTGAEVGNGDLVEVHYHGWLTDSTLFDSSFIREEPFSFNVGTQFVIQGWDQGILGMKKGGERQLVIPPELAYGNVSRPNIPANSTLIFELFLIEVY